MKCNRPVLKYTAGKDLPDMSFSLSNTDLSVFSTIRMEILLDDGTYYEDILSNPYINAIIDDSPGGLFHFELKTGGLPLGTHSANVEYVRTDGRSYWQFHEDETILIEVGEVH